MTWTRRKTTDLLRLLREYQRHYRSYGIGEDDDYKKIGRVITAIDFLECPTKTNRDDYLLRHLAWWCTVVKDRYGTPRFTAIKWLVQLYHDKEGKTFKHKWGASVDSVARRLDSKAKRIRYHKEDEVEYEAALKQCAADVDIYQLTFKVLKLWREPKSV